MTYREGSSRAKKPSAILLWAALLTGGCAVEAIDALIAERGVTECTTSTSESSGELDTSTGSDTSSGASTVETGEIGETGGPSTSTSPETTIGSESSTGPAQPVCGNGIVEDDETCDDGNDAPNDGCQECAKDSIIFITSEIYQGFALGGLYGADQRCRNLAGKAGLPRPLTFKAWLSTSATSAAYRLLHSKGRYVLVNGLVVAQNWTALTSGTIETTITVDENSQTRDTRAWTGTLAKGTPALGSEFCGDWDDDSGLLIFGGTGLSVSTDETWSFYEHGPCGSELRLYCIEQ